MGARQVGKTWITRHFAQFVKDNPGLKGVRLSMKGYADQGRMENMPLYAVARLHGGGGDGA